MSPEQLDEYEERGFIALHDFFTRDELKPVIEEVTQHTYEIQNNITYGDDPTITDKCHFVTEPGTNKLRSVYGAHNTLASVDNLLRSRKIVSHVHQILGDDVYLHQCAINFHQAFTATGYTWHSDFEIFHAEDGMPRMRAQTCIIMLSTNTCESGAIMVIPKSHRVFLSGAVETPADHLTTASKFKLTAGETDNMLVANLANAYGIEYCLGDVGSVVFFDVNLIHGSHSNRSPWNRVNILPVYNSVNNKLVNAFSAPWDARPEYMGSRSPEYVKPILLDK
uniref:Uncharacterized protein LOC100378811 n=1 Tax=Saccoglossus kowalevskii TaxID=10224 RepID=A0ABM0GN54_SACKO|nr:PREDICTED: uncharacterized protein LOC100378811 [Saccoglossus kowalevskii]